MGRNPDRGEFRLRGIWADAQERVPPVCGVWGDAQERVPPVSFRSEIPRNGDAESVSDRICACKKS